MTDALEELESELDSDNYSAVDRAWIDDDGNLHVIVSGQTYGKVSNIFDEYKTNRGVSQIEHEDAVYTGEKRHYVLTA